VELLAQESLTFYEALGRARPLASGGKVPFRATSPALDEFGIQKRSPLRMSFPHHGRRVYAATAGEL